MIGWAKPIAFNENYFSNHLVHLKQGCQTPFLEGHSPAEFSSNPAPTHKPCSFEISLKDFLAGSGAFN